MLQSYTTARQSVMVLYTLVGRGGDAIQLQSLAEALRRIRMNPITLGVSPLQPYRFEKAVDRPRQFLKRLPWWVRGLAEWCANLVLAVRAYRATLIKKPDVLIERMSPYGPAGLLVSLLTGIPLIILLDAPFSLERKDCGTPFWSWFHELILRSAARQAKCVIVGSGTSHAHYLRAGIPESKLTVLPNGVFQDDLVPQLRRTPTNGVPVVGFVGSMASWHRVDLLLEALVQLRARGRVLKAKFVGMGPGYESVEESIRALGLQDSVELVGPVPRVEVLSQIDSFNIAVLPHTLTTGSPMKLFEYAARGIPSVAPDLVNLREIWGADALAYFPAGDATSLANTIDRLLVEPSERVRLAQNAYARVKDRYCWEPQVKKVLDKALAN